ncbi:MAG: hypothetical protein ACRDAM_15820 [Casimicrobium sp.]
MPKPSTCTKSQTDVYGWLLTIPHPIRFALHLLEHARAAVMPFGVFDEHGQLARAATGFVIFGAQ